MQGVGTGRMVHYINQEGEREHLAAVIVHVHNKDLGVVNLAIYTTHGNPVQFFQSSVVYSEGLEPGTWHWPERD